MVKPFLNYSIAMVTPFTAEGDFDAKAFPELVKYHIEQVKAPGLLFSGSTGEQHCMTIAERKQLYKLASESAPKGYPMYAGVAAFKTKDAIELAVAAEEAGFSGIMLGFPPYRLPTQRELFGYVTDVANSTKLPIFLYNNPRRSTVQVSPETYVDLVNSVKHRNIYGIKETGDLDNVPKIKSLLGEKAAADQYFFTGNDDLFVDVHTQYGFNGLTSIVGAVFPEEMTSISNHIQEGKVDASQAMMKDMMPKIKLMQEAGFLQSIKYILRKRGAPAGYCPLPLMEPTDEHKQRLDQLA